AVGVLTVRAPADASARDEEGERGQQGEHVRGPCGAHRLGLPGDQRDQADGDGHPDQRDPLEPDRSTQRLLLRRPERVVAGSAVLAPGPSFRAVLTFPPCSASNCSRTTSSSSPPGVTPRTISIVIPSGPVVFV